MGTHFEMGQKLGGIFKILMLIVTTYSLILVPLVITFGESVTVYQDMVIEDKFIEFDGNIFLKQGVSLTILNSTVMVKGDITGEGYNSLILENSRLNLTSAYIRSETKPVRFVNSTIVGQTGAITVNGQKIDVYNLTMTNMRADTALLVLYNVQNSIIDRLTYNINRRYTSPSKTAIYTSGTKNIIFRNIKAIGMSLNVDTPHFHMLFSGTSSNITVKDSYFHGGGNGGVSGPVKWINCTFEYCVDGTEVWGSSPDAQFLNCTWIGTKDSEINLQSAVTYNFVNCYFSKGLVSLDNGTAIVSGCIFPSGINFVDMGDNSGGAKHAGIIYIINNMKIKIDWNKQFSPPALRYTEVRCVRLSLDIDGSGSLSPSPGSYTYDEGSITKVTATPASGWVLNHWLLDGINVGLANPYSVTMNADHNLTAVFTEVIEHQLIVGTSGNGTTNPPPGTYAYDEGTVASVKAIQNTGYTLDHWIIDGVDTGPINPYNITMDTDHSLTAVFTPVVEHQLIVGTPGNGTTIPSPGTYSYEEGTVASVRAIPNSGFTLDHWLIDGVNTGPVNPYNITMDANHSLTAVFAKLPYLFQDGFESGNFGAWTGTSFTSGETRSISTEQHHHGLYSGMFTSNDDVGADSVYAYKNVDPSPELYARGYIYVSQSGIVDNDDRFYPIIFTAGGQNVAFAGWRRTWGGQLRWSLIVRDGSGYVNAFSASAPQFNRWYSMELHWIGGASGRGDLYVDGVLVASLMNRNTAAYGNVDSVRFGLAEAINCGATTVYGDCLAVSNTKIGTE